MTNTTDDFGRPTVPCGLCGIQTPMLGTKRCDSCFELEGRIQMNPDLARRILAGIVPAAASDDDVTLAEACTAGLLEGDGAGEDHETFLAALRAGGLSEATAKEVHRRTMTHPDAPNMKRLANPASPERKKPHEGALTGDMIPLPDDETAGVVVDEKIMPGFDHGAVKANPAAGASGEAADAIRAILYQADRGNISLPWLLDALRGIVDRSEKANPAAGAEPDRAVYRERLAFYLDALKDPKNHEAVAMDLAYHKATAPSATSERMNDLRALSDMALNPPTREEAEAEDVSDLDPAPMLAKLDAMRDAEDAARRFVASGSSAVYVCPECDIAGCKHYLDAQREHASATSERDAEDAAQWRWVRTHWVELKTVDRRGSLHLRADLDAAIGDEEDAARLDAVIKAQREQSEKRSKEGGK